MKALVFNLRLNSLYSIRIPFSWQSALTYPVLPPSAIFGMLANALQRYKNDKHPIEYLTEVEKNIKWVGAKLTSPTVIKSYTTSAITKWKITIGGKSTNALGREFAFTKDLRIVALSENEKFASEVIKALKNAPITCGDSESLATVEEVKPLLEAKKKSFEPGAEIETEYPIPMSFKNFEIMSGGGRLYMVHEKCKKTDKKFPLVNYIYPIVIEKGILIPTKIRIQTKEAIDGYEIDEVGVIIPNNGNE